jgi:hypothetical protein
MTENFVIVTRDLPHPGPLPKERELSTTAWE